MRQAICGFYQDEHGDWVAHLQCGHNQHVRHDPPWQSRPWTTTEAGRAAMLGRTLPCSVLRCGTKHAGVARIHRTDGVI